MSIDITEVTGGVRFSVRVVPRASRSAIDGAYGTALKIRLQAPPVEGAANAALVELLADVLAVPKSAIRVASGTRGRSKVIEVTGITREHARQTLSRA